MQVSHSAVTKSTDNDTMTMSSWAAARKQKQQPPSRAPPFLRGASGFSAMASNKTSFQIGIATQVTPEQRTTIQNHFRTASSDDIDELGISPAQDIASRSNQNSPSMLAGCGLTFSDVFREYTVVDGITTDNAYISNQTKPSDAPTSSSTLVAWQDIVDSRFDPSISELAGPSDDTKMPPAENVEDGDNNHILGAHWCSDNKHSTYKENYGEDSDDELKTLLFHNKAQAPVSSSTGIHTLDNVVPGLNSLNENTEGTFEAQL
jgi:hypothetical protein